MCIKLNGLHVRSIPTLPTYTYRHKADQETILPLHYWCCLLKMVLMNVVLSC